MIDLIQQAQQLQMEYESFHYPIIFKENSLWFDDNSLSIAPSGMNLLLQLLYDHVDRKKARSLYLSGQLKEFAAYLNECREFQTSEQLWRKGQSFTLAVNDQTIYGVVTKYAPKSNVQVLYDIQNSGLAENIERTTFTYEKMDVFFKHATVLGLEYGLDICNGETGHTAYSFNFYVYENKSGYVFSSPNYSKRKHLGKLGLVDDDLQAIFAEVKEITFEYYILNTDAREHLHL